MSSKDEGVYDEGAVGGDSPAKLRIFPGEPAIAGRFFIHSLAFGEGLVANEAVETASR